MSKQSLNILFSFSEYIHKYKTTMFSRAGILCDIELINCFVYIRFCKCVIDYVVYPYNRKIKIVLIHNKVISILCS